MARIARCLSVSVLTTVLSLSVLAALAGPAGMRPWLANVIATAAGTLPSFELNRRWVWGRRGASDPWREAIPFGAMSFAGMALSTVAVDRTAALTATLTLTPVGRTTLLMAANVGTYASLWLVQFVVLDRVLFRSRAIPSPLPANSQEDAASLVA